MISGDSPAVPDFSLEVPGDSPALPGASLAALDCSLTVLGGAG